MDRKTLKNDGAKVFSGAYLLKVSADGLEAVLTPQEASALPPDPLLLRDELLNLGVVHGVKETPVPLPERKFLVALGTPPVQGENARVRFYAKPSVEKTPKMMDEGGRVVAERSSRVDFREIGGLVNVKAEQLLLEKLPPGEGQPGMDVFGEQIPAKPGRDVKLRLGSGVRLHEEDNKVCAEVNGKFVVVDDKASVLEEHTIGGDIDMSVGNVTFGGGRLEIFGAVLAGFKVRCRGDIFIGKGVNDAEILAGGSISIEGGVVGEGAMIRALADATIDFLENGPKVHVGGEMKVGDACIQAIVKVGGSMKAITGKGLLVGGECVVGGSLYVLELGSEAEVVTEVTVGVNPSIEQKKRILEQEQEVWPARMSETLKNVNTLNKMKKEEGKKFPPDKQELLNKYNAFLPRVMEKVNQLTSLEEEINAEIDKAANECIYVMGRLFPGVKVRIGNAVRVVATEEECVAIRLNRGNMQIIINAMTEDERRIFER